MIGGIWKKSLLHCFLSDWWLKEKYTFFLHSVLITYPTSVADVCSHIFELSDNLHLDSLLATLPIRFDNTVLSKVIAEIWEPGNIPTTKSKLPRKARFTACDVIKGSSLVLTRLGRRWHKLADLWTNDSSKGELPVRGTFFCFRAVSATLK